MLHSFVLEAALGLAFVFALLGLVATALREGVESLLKTRAARLEQGVRELLHDRDAVGLAKDLYEHPLVAALYSGDYRPGRSSGVWIRGRRLPSYIPAENFALALLDLAGRGPGGDAKPLTFESVRANVGQLGNGPVRRVLLTALDASEGDLRRARQNVEAWFDSAMDRVSGAYRRSTQTFLFAIGLLLAVGLNVDAIAVADHLYRNDAKRIALVRRAEAFAPSGTEYGQALDELQSLELPIGRGAKPKGFFADWIAPIPGWTITALATMLGAPFWFDLLGKITVVRATVKPRPKNR